MKINNIIYSKGAKIEAFLYSAEAPNDRQMQELISFLRKKYNSDVTLTWVEDVELSDGFRIEVGRVEGDDPHSNWKLDSVYDWSLKGRLQQLKDDIAQLSAGGSNIIPLMKETIKNWTPKALEQEIGTVLAVGDGIATISGLNNAAYREIVVFSSGVRGKVVELNRDVTGCILFDEDQSVAEGSTVRRTGRTAGMPVGDEFTGRVINALGSPIDGKGPIKAEDYLPIESPAPGIIDRKPVSKPLETGILAIDSLFPIGHGQRELIIGDRQTGKTTIALDTILNQKGKNVICIYVAIGQKASSVAHTVDILRKHGAMEYSIVVNASASEPAPLQYIAPYAGCTLGEYFMRKGQRVLIVYDDLTKHATAYRSLSLLLERSPGREAYPGDVFYLHSRLLERSAQLSDEKGGGSMTALPIVETQAGNVSAYIPTNIISITDGQIFLESELFFSGQRPAVNIGLSVSRVGGDAQTEAMKRAVGTLRLELAQYHEMEVFMQFASDLDDTTRQQLDYGHSLMQVLRQEKHRPMKEYEQIIILVAALNRIMMGVPPEKISGFKYGLLNYIEKEGSHIIRKIENGEFDEKVKEEIIKISQEYLNIFHGGGK
ncbi:F0F1 ATP synthase subunit alpha [Acetivibrio saccincola]|jgi:F-type H+-transporting ATPase subunit alpha|uniref:ATP synthase subunit alpha n=1 Tax=Acetivibrio saccincola TaxID=1677857 RepID=A0A2K9EFM4_9FIRM|nr:F0F1 ATP synthase subunit alpha [Acetivibrio saccincola]AUG56693.1 ATP synthase subunit alpha [Acetivibrio saccincola]NLW26466.1 F0F1 ATP synthase subunit alpha [Acetivibrio saccincola]PQQ66750.1 F0F1 ATP synthase subunit alpha [Acetivibrio saccincola]